MANNRFNKQVSPKGYKAGGQVSPTKKAGSKAGRPKSTPSKQQRKMGVGQEMPKRKKPKIILYKGEQEGPAKRFTTLKEIPLNFKKGGSALKPVQPNQKGLSKLPTEVRNKMGYMKKGGKVHGK